MDNPINVLQSELVKTGPLSVTSLWGKACIDRNFLIVAEDDDMDFIT